jgi:hypothetical protein
MASLTTVRKKAMIDYELATGGAHTHIGYSINGTSETSIVARTPISRLGGWSTPIAASTYAPANASAGDSDAANGGGTVTHYATFSALSGGTQLTDWIATTDPDPVLVTGGKLTHAAGAIVPISVT